MVNQKDTMYLLERFFGKSFEFWINEGKDDREAFESALDETKGISTNPFSPQGDKLDPEAKAKFIKYREMDLGI